jgi:tetratricopeptide (TPR) repeat protein
MKFAELYHRLLNMPSPAGLAIGLGVGALLVIVGLLISFGKRQWLSRSLSALGLILIMLVFFTVRQQQITERTSPIVTQTRYRYLERTRLYAGAGLLGVPVVTSVVLFAVLMAHHRKLRAQVPRHLKAGRKHFIQQEYDAALREYNHAIHVAPQAGEAYCRRGAVFRVMGQFELALADFGRAIERDPRLAAAYLERGKTLTETGDLDGALADFQQLMLLRGNEPELYLNRGICLLKKGLTSDAATDFERVLKLTNHSDFAEPAKKYLRQLEGQPSPSAPTNSVNGPPVPPYSPKPAAQDYVL